MAERKTINFKNGLTTSIATIGNIFVTGGNVGIGTTSPSYLLDITGNLNVNGSILQNGLPSSQWTGSIGNTLSYTSGTVIMTNSSISNSTITNSLITNLAFTTVSAASATATIGTIISTNISSTNLTAGSIQATNLAFTTVSAASATATIGTIVATNVNSTNITTTSVLATGASATNLAFTTVSAGSATATIGTIVSTNQRFTNTTITNLVTTAITAGAITVTGGGLSATFNTNTLGNIFTTGGNVGIGTAVPSQRLTVSGGSILLNSGVATGRIAIQNTTTGSTLTSDGFQLVHDGTAAYIAAYDSNPLRIIVNGGTTRMSINTDGNVGIGMSTNNPVYRLDVTGDIRITNGSLLVSNVSAGSATATIGTVVATNISSTNITVASILATGASATNLAFTNVSAGSATATIGTVVATNISSTNITVASILATGASATNLAFTTVSAGSATATIGTVVATNISTTNETVASILATGASATNLAFTTVSAGSATATIGTVVATNISTTNETVASILATGASATNLAFTTVSAASATATIGAVISTNMLSTNTTTTNLVTSSVIATNDTSALVLGATNLTLTDASFGGRITLHGGNIADQYGGYLRLIAYGSTNPLADGNTIIFLRRTGVDTVSESMRIDHLGNLGIGTVSPSYKLDVIGDVRITSGSLLVSSISAASASASLGTILATNITATNITVTNLVALNETVVNLTTTNQSVQNVIVSDDIITTDLSSANSTITNILSTNITATNLAFTTVSAGSATATIGTIVSTNVSATNIAFTTVSAGSATATIGTLVSTNVNSTNTTIVNLVTTAITAGAITVTGGGLSATDNSNTLGSIFTTGGNVGIGTTSPTVPLDVAGTFRSSSGNGAMLFDGNLDLRSANTYTTFNLQSSAAQTKIFSYTDNKTYFQSSGDVIYAGIDTVALRGLCITTAGNIGIGTTSPSVQLHVEDGLVFVGDVGSGFSPTVPSGPGGNPTANGYRLYFDNSYNATPGTGVPANKIVIHNNNYTCGFGMEGSGLTYHSGYAHNFYTATGNPDVYGTVYGTNTMNINPTGVGIGTVNQNVQLTVHKPGINIASPISTGLVEFRGSQTSTVGESVLRIGRGHHNGNFWGSSAEFNVRRGYVSGTDAASGLDILLGAGQSDNPDTIVMTLLANGYVGIGTISPAYQLQLSSDSAAKPSTNTWTISSDIRLKKDIVDADLNLCYNNVKTIPLKRYTWKDDVYTVEQVNDRSKLGWIAQDVELIFPKAVEQKQMFGYTDCRTLNSDQIYASMYGAIQKLIIDKEIIETELQTTKTELQTTKTELQTAKTELQTAKTELQTTITELQTLKAFLQMKYPGEI